MNLINNKDNKCFQYAVTVSVNREEIKKERTKFKPFITKYNWKRTNYPSTRMIGTNLGKII